MDLSAITDDQLHDMRTEPKRRVSATRQKLKGQHIEQQYDCESLASENRNYKVFTRQHATRPNIFSVGLCLVQQSGTLVLCRYNSGYHPHRNVIERNRVPARSHIHLATERYIAAQLDPDGFAFETDRFSTIKQALRCLVADCAIEGILDLDGPETMDLFK